VSAREWVREIVGAGALCALLYVVWVVLWVIL
jgi:hypothetical protein